MKITGNYLLISPLKKLIFYKSHSISCIFFVNSVMCYIKVRQINALYKISKEILFLKRYLVRCCFFIFYFIILIF